MNPKVFAGYSFFWVKNTLDTYKLNVVRSVTGAEVLVEFGLGVVGDGEQVLSDSLTKGVGRLTNVGVALRALSGVDDVGSGTRDATKKGVGIKLIFGTDGRGGQNEPTNGTRKAAAKGACVPERELLG